MCKIYQMNKRIPDDDCLDCKEYNSFEWFLSSIFSTLSLTGVRTKGKRQFFIYERKVTGAMIKKEEKNEKK